MGLKEKSQGETTILDQSNTEILQFTDVSSGFQYAYDRSMETLTQPQFEHIFEIKNAVARVMRIYNIHPSNVNSIIANDKYKTAVQYDQESYQGRTYTGEELSSNIVALERIASYYSLPIGMMYGEELQTEIAEIVSKRFWLNFRSPRATKFPTVRTLSIHDKTD